MYPSARVLLFVLALLQVAWAANQRLRLTPDEYKAFKLALNGHYPVNLRSALTLLSLRNTKSDKFVYVDVPTKRLILPSKVVHSVPHKIHNTYKAHNGYRGSRAPGRVQRNFLERMVGKFSQTKNVQDLLLPIYRDQLDNLTPISKRRQFTKKEAEQRRNKRDTYATEEDEEDEEEVKYVEELSFGLSTAGGVLGGTVGGYLDTTGTATLKLIRSLESLGLLALGQFDDFLDQQEEEKNNNY